MKRGERTRNAMAAAVTSTIAAASVSTPARIEFRSGSQPANCAAPRTGTLLGQASIPGSYMAAPAGGQQQLSATVSGLFSASDAIGYYSIICGDGVCEEQGSVTLVGGGGDAELAAASLITSVGQPFTITIRNLVGGGA